MKATELLPLIRRYILPNMPGFGLRGRMIVEEPIDWLLRTVMFDGYQYHADWLRISAVVQPLYVPNGYIHYAFGRQLGLPVIVTAGREEEAFATTLGYIRREAMPLLEQLKTPADVAAQGNSFPSSSDRIHVFENVAYSAVIAGDYVRARENFAKVARECRQNDNPYKADFYGEINQRCARVEAALAISSDAALAVLREWRDYTFDALKLADPPQRRKPRNTT